MASGYPYFCIVSSDGLPVYEAWFGAQFSEESLNEQQPKDDLRYFHQFLAHKAIDSISDFEWTTPAMYLRVVDEFNEWLVSAFLTSGHAKMLLLHERSLQNGDGIRNFFHEMHELYVKAMLNPLMSPTTPITSTTFRERVQRLAQRYL